MADAQFEYLTFVHNWPVGVLEIPISDSPVNQLIMERLPIREEWTQSELPLKINTFLSGVITYEEALQVSDEFANKVLMGIAFVGEFLVCNLLLQHGRFDGKTVFGGPIGQVSNSVISVGRIDLPFIGQELQDHLGTCEGAAQRYYMMFYAAMGTSGIGKYLLLYLILLTHFQDEQRQVDNFIRKHEAGVVETPRPTLKQGGTPVSETVYTRLRNEVGHHRPGVSQTTTMQEIEQHTPGLIALVKKMIAQV